MEQNYLGIRFCENDKEIYEAIKMSFPDCLMVPSEEFEGIEILWIAIIPIAEYGLQLLDFIITHVIPKTSKRKINSDDNADNNIQKKRELISDGKSIDANELVGKTKDEISKNIKVKIGVEFKIDIKIGKND